MVRIEEPSESEGHVVGARAADGVRPARGSDPLTGLLDRSEIERQLVGLDPAEAARRGVGVVFLDLDRFKPVNDKFGHAAGDAVLRIIAERLSAAVRPGDVLARFGGDEFVVVCDGAASHDLHALARRLVDAVAEPISLGETTVTVGASAGVAVAGSVEGPVTLLEQADLAMYLAKSERAGVMEFDSAVAQQLLTRTAERSDLEDAMRRGAIRTQLRPVVAAGTRRPMALESRLVWSEGDVLAVGAELRDRARSLGMLSDLLRHEVTEACAAAANLRSLRPDADRLRVLVRIDGDDITDHEVAGALRGTLDSDHRAGTLGLVVRGAGRWDDDVVADDLRAISAMDVALVVEALVARDVLESVDRWSASTMVLDDDLVVAAVDRLREREVLRAEVALARAVGVRVMARCPDEAAAVVVERIGVDEIAGEVLGSWCAADAIIETFERLWDESLRPGAGAAPRA